METRARNQTGYEKWRNGIDRADSRWDEYDGVIREVIGSYSRHLAARGGYRPLDWRIVKAMLWTETGPHSKEWGSRPLRIGVPGDPGLRALLSGREGGELIMSPTCRVIASEAQILPRANIRAGVGYLLMRLAEYGFETVVAPDARIFEVAVRRGDTLERIARANGSTTAVLASLNPHATRMLREGMLLRCQRASTQKVVTGWRSPSYRTVALRYNGGGDPLYAQKLEYAMNVIRRREPQ
ncbi:MAG: LysM peptidoglycan-binding domain-containing protein [Variovorax sp.]|nr:LysM peptidoglycan-binding domain-containing protein [Variovorax sp.]